MTSIVNPPLASPADFAAYGDYTIPAAAFEQVDGHTRVRYPFGGRIRDDGSGDYPAEPGRYHLYVSLYCPWAQRALIPLLERRLESVISWSQVDPVRDGRGWAFRDGHGHGPDPVNGFALLRDAYEATEPGFDGHVSVPTLWDRETGRIVSNHYPSLTVDLATEFRAWADPVTALFPDAARTEIERLEREIETDVIHSARAAGAARTQEDYDRRSATFFSTLRRFDEWLADHRYLLGDQLTDADVLLWVNLARFDLVTAPQSRLFAHRLADFPNLWAYARDLYQRPAFRTATDFEHLVRGAYRSRGETNPSRIIPNLPNLDWDEPTERVTLSVRSLQD